MRELPLLRFDPESDLHFWEKGLVLPVVSTRVELQAPDHPASVMLCEI